MQMANIVMKNYKVNVDEIYELKEDLNEFAEDKKLVDEAWNNKSEETSQEAELEYEALLKELEGNNNILNNNNGNNLNLNNNNLVNNNKQDP